MPLIGTEYSAGLDLKSAVTCVLEPGHTVKIGTGVRVELPKYTMGLVVPRSSLGKGTDAHIVLKNTAGVIDSDYRGEIMITLVNLGSESFPIYEGDRLCQLVVVPIIKPDFKVVTLEDLSTTTRGTGGFGHTGK